MTIAVSTNAHSTRVNVRDSVFRVQGYNFGTEGLMRSQKLDEEEQYMMYAQLETSKRVNGNADFAAK